MTHYLERTSHSGIVRPLNTLADPAKTQAAQSLPLSLWVADDATDLFDHQR